MTYKILSDTVNGPDRTFIVHLDDTRFVDIEKEDGKKVTVPDPEWVKVYTWGPPTQLFTEEYKHMTRDEFRKAYAQKHNEMIERELILAIERDTSLKRSDPTAALDIATFAVDPKKKRGK